MTHVHCGRDTKGMLPELLQLPRDELPPRTQALPSPEIIFRADSQLKHWTSPRSIDAMRAASSASQACSTSASESGSRLSMSSAASAARSPAERTSACDSNSWVDLFIPGLYHPPDFTSTIHAPSPPAILLNHRPTGYDASLAPILLPAACFPYVPARFATPSPSAPAIAREPLQRAAGKRRLLSDRARLGALAQVVLEHVSSGLCGPHGSAAARF